MPVCGDPDSGGLALPLPVPPSSPTSPSTRARQGPCYAPLVRVQRQDRAGRLSKAKRVNGRVIVPASLTRSGVFVYLNPDGSERREYRPAEEVFREDSLASLAGAPVTFHHPRSGKASREDSYGAALPARKGGDGRHVEADLALVDGTDLTAEIDADRIGDVSCGYDCVLLPEKGTSPEGEAYDFVQREIVYNHVAIVPRGRAGTAALRLDDAGNQINEPPGETHMKTERIDGVDYEVDSPAHKAVVAHRKAVDTLTAERDAVKAQLADKAARLDAVEKTIPERVAARVALALVAKGHEVEVRADQSDDEIRRAILAKVAPSMKLDGKSEDYVRAALDFATSQDSGESAARVRMDLAEPVRTVVTDALDLPPDEIARRKSLRKMQGLES